MEYVKHYRLLIYLITMEECDESGEGASINADRYSEKLGVQYGPTAAGRRSALSPNFEE